MPFLVILILIAVTVAIILLLRTSARQRRTITKLNVQLAEQAKAVAACQRRQGLLFSSNPWPMWIYDCQTLRFLEVNDAAVRTYGYSREQFLAMTVVDIRPEEDVSSFLKSAGMRHDGYNAAGVWRHRFKDGSIILAEIIAFEFQNADHQEELVLALDVTKRCHAENALRESEASLKALVDNAPFGISQSLIEGNHIKTLNPALCKMLGDYSVEEALRDPGARVRLRAAGILIGHLQRTGPPARDDA